MSRKGVSYDEKKLRAQQFFWESGAVFTMKELESQLPKHKGIVSQSVKEIIGALVADGIVDSDKIGSGNFFWSLPSKSTHNKQQQIESLKQQIEQNQQRSVELQSEYKLAVKNRSSLTSKERSSKLQKLSDTKSSIIELDRELVKYSNSDPERISRLESGIIVTKAAANRWTDNLMQLINYYKSRAADASTEDILKGLQLPKDLDYIE